MVAAAMAINCPASETDTFSERAMSFSVPGAAITPQAMTKLPNIKAQLTSGRKPAAGLARGALATAISAGRAAPRG